MVCFQSSGLLVPPSCTQDQFHRSRFIRLQGFRIHLRITGERTQIFRNQDGEGSITSKFFEFFENGRSVTRGEMVF